MYWKKRNVKVSGRKGCLRDGQITNSIWELFQKVILTDSRKPHIFVFHPAQQILIFLCLRKIKKNLFYLINVTYVLRIWRSMLFCVGVCYQSVSSSIIRDLIRITNISTQSWGRIPIVAGFTMMLGNCLPYKAGKERVMNTPPVESTGTQLLQAFCLFVFGVTPKVTLMLFLVLCSGGTPDPAWGNSKWDQLDSKSTP